ncbi:MAG: transporter substrate-binding domain-containing protein [Thermoanaerobaculales bacterium]|jgi:membrane-bound lytic murein transglycosylase MltF|nr:transporter substrate-binding domain-containing protein [Thermoanaerobaculales bacterium]
MKTHLSTGLLAMLTMLLLGAGMLVACSDEPPDAAAGGPVADPGEPAAELPADEADPEPIGPSGALPEDDLSVALAPWKGDYDGMVERRMVRILVPYSMTNFFLDGASKRGIVAALGRDLEQEINRRERLRTRLVHVVFIPTPRDRLIPWLVEGIGDIAAGGMTVTEARREVVDFSRPLIRDSEEIVCTAPGVPGVRSVEDLSGREVVVQAASSYRESLAALNRSFEARGLAPIDVVTIEEPLEADEVLDMVQAGLIPMTVVDRYLAEFWGQVFSNLEVHPDVVVAAEQDLAWAFRKDSPRLEGVLNDFLTPRRHRTKYGNILFRRYLQSTNWVRGATVSADQRRFEQTRPLFEKYGATYRLDPVLLTALAYQESRLDQSVRSPAGAIGVMQLLRSTGDWMNVGDITLLEPNIHAGAKYFRLLMDTVEEPEVTELNRVFFALASYNGGQTRIRRLRRETTEQGLDPNLWFDNVELSVARVIGRETVQYVGNIYKLYLAFRMAEERRGERAQRTAGRGGPAPSSP